MANHLNKLSDTSLQAMGNLRNAYGEGQVKCHNITAIGRESIILSFLSPHFLDTYRVPTATVTARKMTKMTEMTEMAN